MIRMGIGGKGDSRPRSSIFCRIILAWKTVIQITPHMRRMVAVEPADFRKGIDGLAGIYRKVLREDPFAGSVFVFRKRKGTSIKLLLF